jgi:hypothetical protein
MGRIFKEKWGHTSQQELREHTAVLTPLTSQMKGTSEVTTDINARVS